MARGFYTQKITSDDKTQVTYAYNGYKSMTFTNTHTAAVAITLYVTSQLTTDITTTGVYVTSQLGTDITDTDSAVNFSAGYASTTSSQAIVIDNGGTAGTSDMFLNEKVYLSSGKLVGTCTTFGSATSLTFSGGLVNTIANNDKLYTGTRYTMFKITIPSKIALQLHPEDFEFDTESYNMYILSTHASGLIDIITRY